MIDAYLGSAITRTENRLGRAWDEWRAKGETSGYLWFIEQGGIDAMCIACDNPSAGNHALASPQDVGWLSREQFMARMTRVARCLPLLDANGN